MPSGSRSYDSGSEGELPQNSVFALTRIREMLNEVACRESGRLPTERELAELLGMSRRAIRRALEVLEAEGLVWRKHGSGTYIGAAPQALPVSPAPISAPARPGAFPATLRDGAPVSLAGLPLTSSPASLIHVIEARLLLEPSLARLAALRTTGEVVQQLRRLSARVETADDVDSADLWDSAFHREIARAAGNPVLLSLFDQINLWRHDEGLRRIRLRARHAVGTPPELGAEHGAIIDAIAAGDDAAAAAAMRTHLGMLQKIFLRYAQEEIQTDV